MADVRFVPNTAGFNELRNSPAVQSMCLGYAQRYASAANGSSSSYINWTFKPPA